METKACSKCGEELPKTTEYFRATKRKEGEFRGECKACISKYNKQYRAENRELLIEKQKQHRADNLESLREWQREYRRKNKDYHVERDRIYREKTKEKTSKRQKIWNETHKEYVTIRFREYRKKHIDKYRIHSQKRRELRNSLPSTLTNEQWKQCQGKFSNRCCYCGKENKLTIEHFVPVSKNGELSINNIIPSCVSCNSSKGNRLFGEWYPNYRHYSKKREAFILTYLGYKNGIQQLALM